MGRIKSLLTRVIFDEAKHAHNCQGNSAHRIVKGERRLNVRNGRSWDRYCLNCARAILRTDSEKLAALERQTEL